MQEDQIDANSTIGASTMFDGLFDEFDCPEESIENTVFDEKPEPTKQSQAGSTTLGVSYTSPSDSVHTIPRFVYQAQLGEGAYGRVWKAVDEDIGRDVAIKSYKFKGATGQKLCSTELQIAGKIDHPNVPVIYDVERSEDDSYHFVMKFIEGQQLTELIEKLKAGDKELLEQYKLEQRIEIIVQILRVLSTVHSKGIVHRDIKPENIMVGPNGEAYLMDWGIAIDTNITAAEGVLAGSPLYMSPEQARQEALDQRSDLFSLTAVFYELLFLEYYGPEFSTVEELIEKIGTNRKTVQAHCTLGTDASVPMPLANILNKGLDADPSKRFQSSSEMLSEIQRYRSGFISVGCPHTILLAAANRFTKWMHRYPLYSMILVWGSVIVVPYALIKLGMALA